MGLKNVSLTSGRRLFVPSTTPREVVGCRNTNPLTDVPSSSHPSSFPSMPPVSAPGDPCHSEIQNYDEIDLMSELDMDHFLGEKFQEESGSSLLRSEFCTCHNVPKGSCSQYITIITKFVNQVIWDK